MRLIKPISIYLYRNSSMKIIVNASIFNAFVGAQPAAPGAVNLMIGH